jgi:hypothetical protein
VHALLLDGVRDQAQNEIDERIDGVVVLLRDVLVGAASVEVLF